MSDPKNAHEDDGVTENTDSSSQSRLGHPLSSRKLAANRANAQKSTGPRTERGKNCSRTNAIKHGCYAELAMEGLKHVRGFEKIQQLLDALREQYPPRTALDALRLETVTLDVWRRARAVQAEIAITANPQALYNDWVNNVVRFTSAVDRMTAKSFEILAQLDREAADREAEQPHPEPGEELPQAEVDTAENCSDQPQAEAITARWPDPAPEALPPVVQGFADDVDTAPPSAATTVVEQAEGRGKGPTKACAINEELAG